MHSNSKDSGPLPGPARRFCPTNRYTLSYKRKVPGTLSDTTIKWQTKRYDVIRFDFGHQSPLPVGGNPDVAAGLNNYRRLDS